MKRIIYIVTLIVGLNFTASAQERISNEQVPQVKILKFYPNPASSVINFDFQRSYDKSYTLQVYNFMGKKVYEIKNIPPRINVSLEEFYRGIYIFQVRDKNGIIIESGKFQVVK